MKDHGASKQLTSHDVVTRGAQRHIAHAWKELDIMINMWPCLVNGI